MHTKDSSNWECTMGSRVWREEIYSNCASEENKDDNDECKNNGRGKPQLKVPSSLRQITDRM